MASTSQLKLLRELDLLVSTGVGVAPIAPALGSVLSKIVGAESYGLCWFDEAGMPQGFCHHGATTVTEELFMNHYEELFVGPYEYTPFWRMRNKGRDVGNALRSSKEYFRSNTYNLLIKPCGWHFLLDELIDIDCVTRLTVCFFRSAENPFTETDQKKLTALVPVLRRAICKPRHGLVSRSAKAETGHMLVSVDGQQMEMLDASAEKLLTTIKLFDQNASLIKPVTTPPRFVQLLCERLRVEPINTAEKEIDLAGGVVACPRQPAGSHPFCITCDADLLVCGQ